MELPDNVLINANTLRNSSIQKKEIRYNVIQILHKICDELKVAHREGKHCIITEIPIVFDIPNMSNANSQRAIWSDLIENLKEKNYRVWIRPKSKSCILKITWMSEDDELNIKHQIQVLALHSVS